MIKCKDCGNKFKELSSHLRYSNCDWPKMGKETKNILIGSILGDGSVDWSGNNHRILVRNTKRYYLEEISDYIGDICHSITTENRDNGKNMYSLNTMSHPKINKIVEPFYDKKQKVFPELEPESKILEHWYYQDGSYHNGRCRIQMVNFSDYRDRVTSFFEESGIGKPYYDTSSGSFRAEFSVEQSKDFIDYISPKSSSVFGYKFP